MNRAIRLLREYHGISQTVMASRLQISNSYLSEIESGQKTASMELLAKYSDIFSMPLSSILLFSERVEEGRLSERVRIGGAKKILSLLEWISEREKSVEGEPR